MSAFALADIPANPDFREKFDELQRLIEADHVPVWIKAESAVLGNLTFKLFHRVYEPSSAVGTPHLLPGFHASDLLCELIQAYGAFDWPRVSVLIHGASSDATGRRKSDSALSDGEGR